MGGRAKGGARDAYELQEDRAAEPVCPEADHGEKRQGHHHEQQGAEEHPPDDADTAADAERRDRLSQPHGAPEADRRGEKQGRDPETGDAAGQGNAAADRDEGPGESAPAAGPAAGGKAGQDHGPPGAGGVPAGAAGGEVPDEPGGPETAPIPAAGDLGSQEPMGPGRAAEETGAEQGRADLTGLRPPGGGVPALSAGVQRRGQRWGRYAAGADGKGPHSERRGTEAAAQLQAPV